MPPAFRYHAYARPGPLGSSHVLPDKVHVRDQMRRRRAALAPQQRRDAARHVHRLLFDAPFLRQVRHVACYCSMPDEIDTLAVIRRLLADGASVCAPIIVGHGIMHMHRVTSLDDLAPGKFGILAPQRPDPIDVQPQVTLCPGVAFTPRGDRIGLGAGYFDRYLAAHPDTTPVALAYDFQIVEAFATDPFDRPMRYIVTDTRVIDCTTGNSAA